MRKLIRFLTSKMADALSSESAKQRWENLPEFGDYQRQAASQGSFDSDHPRCTSCQSPDLWHYGLQSAEDIYRIHCCLGCGASLWRSEVSRLIVDTRAERRQA